MKKWMLMLSAILLLGSRIASADDFKISPCLLPVGIYSVLYDHQLNNESELSFIYTRMYVGTPSAFFYYNNETASISYKKMIYGVVGNGAYVRFGVGRFGTFKGGQSSYSYIPVMAFGFDILADKPMAMSLDLGTEYAAFSVGFRF